MLGTEEGIPRGRQSHNRKLSHRMSLVQISSHFMHVCTSQDWHLGPWGHPMNNYPYNGVPALGEIPLEPTRGKDNMGRFIHLSLWI